MYVNFYCVILLVSFVVFDALVRFIIVIDTD
jgi:hypothetical protein